MRHFLSHPHALVLTTCALAVNQAWGQQAAAPQPAASAASAAASAAPAAIQEVVVTATKVTTAASKTPVALSVIGGDELKSAGAVSAAQLTDLVPNVQIGLNNGAMDINIRGVSSNDNTEKGDPSASFNVGGVNLARPQSAGLAFFDLERVEILRGPQGTLYGRNSTAGAVNLITNKPQPRFHASVGVDVGNYDSTIVDGMINVPVSDSVALRAAVESSDHKGYIATHDEVSGATFSQGRDDQRNLSARLSGLISFSPDTSLLLTADTSQMKGDGVGSIDASAFLADRSLRSTASAIKGNRDDSANGASAEFKSRFAFGELTYLYGHRELDLNEDNSLGSAAATSVSLAHFSQDSHELRLASAGQQALQWVGGLYAFDEHARSYLKISNALPFGDGSLLYDQNPVKSTSYAAFGQATWAFAPDSHLTLGARETQDHKSREGLNTTAGFMTAPNDASVSYSQSNWKIGADTLLAKDVMIYASAATGYKAGGFNDGDAASNPNLTYKPEHLIAYEGGLKGKFLDNRLQLNLAGFYYDYSDLQVSSVSAQTNTLQTQNAARARIYGGELEARYAVTPEDRVNLSISALSAKYRSYLPADGIDWSDRSLDKSPKGTVALGLSHYFEFDSGASLEAHVDTRWSSAYVVSDFSTATQYSQPSYTQTNLRLSWSSADDHWRVELYGRNLENKNVITGYNFGTFTLADPRLYGVRTSYSF